MSSLTVQSIFFLASAIDSRLSPAKVNSELSLVTARLTYIDDILTKKSKSVTLTSKPCPSLGMMLRKSLNLRILSCQILMKSIKGS